MRFFTLASALALPIVSVLALDPTRVIERQASACTTNEVQPPPRGVRCGTEGSVSRPRKISDFTNVATQTACRDKCINDPSCLSFAYTPSTLKCTTYTASPAAMNFVAGTTGTFFYSRPCYTVECNCGSNKTVCSNKCVNTLKDKNNCGTCGNLCPADRVCKAGACICTAATPFACPPASGAMYGVCVNKNTDSNNCGGCGNICPMGSTCQAGSCVCTTGGQTPCQSGCTNTNTDDNHCGDCSTQCTGDLHCQGGSCKCPSTGNTEVCNGDQCKNLATDNDNCGNCGTQCGQGQSCSGSSCQCPANKPTFCDGNGGCVNTDTNDSHCGSCGNSCPNTSSNMQECNGSGACQCSDQTQSLCSGQCVDVINGGDTNNCGACGKQCGDNQTCEAGVCTCTAANNQACNELPFGSPPVCRNTNTDEDNCGSCGNPCTGNFACTSGTCKCGDNTDCGPDQACSGSPKKCKCTDPSKSECDGDCFDLTSDPANCGQCGFACQDGQDCNGSACECTNGDAICVSGGPCVDTDNDSSNCGGCGNVCDTDEKCVLGNCVCNDSNKYFCDIPGGTGLGARECRNLNTDSDCGSCDNACPDTADNQQSCQTAGSTVACDCTDSSESQCNGVCFDKQTSNDNCGTCGTQCPSEAPCTTGACTCTDDDLNYCPATNGPGSCYDFDTDEGHCGECGNECLTDERCNSGTCNVASPSCNPTGPSGASSFYNNYFFGKGYSLNTMNPGNKKKPAKNRTFDGSLSTCDAIQACATFAYGTSPEPIYQSFGIELHNIGGSLSWECAAYYRPSTDPSKWNVPDSSADTVVRAYGYSA